MSSKRISNQASEFNQRYQKGLGFRREQDRSKFPKPFVKPEVKVKKQSNDIELPSLATFGSVGYELAAYLPNGDIELQPQESVVIPTGLSFAIPGNCEMQLRGRSGLAFKSGIWVFPGTIDSDYRGEIQILLYNTSKEVFTVINKMRIAQAIFSRIERPVFKFVDELLPPTKRGENGFGSTGLFANRTERGDRGFSRGSGFDRNRFEGSNNRGGSRNPNNSNFVRKEIVTEQVVTTKYEETPTTSEK